MLSRWSLLAALLVLTFGMVGCKDAKKEAVQLKRCERSRCTKPNKCLKGPTGNYCVALCKNDKECPGDLLCTGRYGGWLGLSDKGGYCRRASSGLGESCKGIEKGCKRGLGCFRGKCHKQCKTHDTCGKKEACVPIVTKKLVGRGKSLYKVCLTATLRNGDRCGKKVKGLCQRNLVCAERRCMRPCKNDNQCRSSQRCRGYHRSYRVGVGFQSFNYCVNATQKEGESCSRKRGACVRGLTCISRICRKICKSASGCGEEQKCIGAGYTNRFRTFGKPDFRYCLDATREEGETCGTTKTVCKHKLYCWYGRCRRPCRRSRDCTGRRRCRGRYWKNKYMKGVGRPDYRYCR